jgi:hypothetical protein
MATTTLDVMDKNSFQHEIKCNLDLAYQSALFLPHHQKHSN